jgi:biotin operon repressor
MTEDQTKKAVVSMCKDGLTHTLQAERLGISVVSVQRIVNELRLEGVSLSRRRRKKSVADADELVRLTAAGYTQAAIGERLGMSQARVSVLLRRLRENGVPVQKGNRPLAAGVYTPGMVCNRSDRDVAASIVRLRTEQRLTTATISIALLEPYERIVYLIEKMAEGGIVLPPPDRELALRDDRMAVLNMTRRGLPVYYMAEVLSKSPAAISQTKRRLRDCGFLRRDGYPPSLYPVDE